MAPESSARRLSVVICTLLLLSMIWLRAIPWLKGGNAVRDAAGFEQNTLRRNDDESTAELALQAREHAKEALCELGISWTRLIMHHDRGSAFTSYRWTNQFLITDQLRLYYALNGARDNPWMEACNSRFKVEGQSLFNKVQNQTKLGQIVGGRMTYHNTGWRYSSLGYVTPLVFIQQQEQRRANQA